MSNLSPFLRLEHVTKVYRTHENVFLSQLGDLFERTQDRWNLREIISPAALERFYRGAKEEFEAKKTEWRHKTNLTQRAKYLRDIIFKEDEFAVTALVNVDLQFEHGEFSSIAGPSGSGKTTLLNIIATLEEPSDGTVYFEGKALESFSEDARADFRLHNLGFVFQAFNLIPVLSASENIEYALILKGVAAMERRKRVTEALAFVGLSDCAHRRPNRLSGGQQQRVAIARALAGRPKLILADEPTANIDSKTADSLLDLMERINREDGTTFIFSSHDQTVLSRARRVVRLRDGGIVSDLPAKSETATPAPQAETYPH